MPDISMCTGGECSLKESCYRYKAKPNIYQSYMRYEKITDNKKECDSYWKIEYEHRRK